MSPAREEKIAFIRHSLLASLGVTDEMRRAG
jgi:hypothetical protein